MSANEIHQLQQSLRSGGGMLLILGLNLLAYCAGHMLLGGSALLAETHEDESYLRPLHGDEFPVSSAIGWYSLLHGILAILSLPSIALCLVMLAYEWIKLQILRRRASAGP